VSSDAAAGIVLCDKPAGPTSHDMVARARRALGERRIGHAGTLDPFATGLVILLVGGATRLARHFTELPKAYEVVARLGARSSTGDPEGEIVETGVIPGELRLPLGLVRQRPPAHSAVKIDGERAYARARRGEEVVTAEREVTVYESEQLWRDGDRVALRFVCSSGTYVRSLVADLGDAYCLSLRRLSVGPFEAAGGWPGEGRAHVLGIADAWVRFGAVATVDAQDAGSLRHGRPIAARRIEGSVLIVDGDGNTLAVAAERDGMLRVEVGLAR
jgi:tRNA pseudouridine55 synthase